MDAQPVRIDGIEVYETASTLTATLFAGGDPVLRMDMLDYGRAEEVTNSAGVTAHGPVSSWTLIDGVLTFEYNARAAETLGFPQLHSLSLDLPETDLGRLREALLEILTGTCCEVETPQGRFVH